MQPTQSSSFKNMNPFKVPIVALVIILAVVVITIARIHNPLVSRYSPAPESSAESTAGGFTRSPPAEKLIDMVDEMIKCDIFTGEWVPNPDAPYYTDTSCWAIFEHLNCVKYGRPDTEFMKWRWKPDSCELPIFNPYQFLDIVRGKSLAFIGDSVGRNQMQSLICLLSRVEFPVDVSYTSDENFKRWEYLSYNFTLAYFYSPFLVKFEDTPSNGLYNLYLDELDENWSTQIHEFDYVILNAGHSFPRPGIYYENRRVVGCRYCQQENVPDLPTSFGYRKAFKTAFRAFNTLKDFNGIVFLRTFSPSHFENGEWNNGGDCARKNPLKSNEIMLEGHSLDLYLTQLEEFRAAEKEGEKRGVRFRLFDTTQAMLLRPDGHPSKYGQAPQENVTLHNDCTNWCLPGPIDSWSDFLLYMLKIEGRRSRDFKLRLQKGKLRR